MNLIDLVLDHPDVVKPPNRAGEALGWCPWHPDKEGGHPSLGINEKKRIVKCFVCGNGGLKRLARAWGIEVPGSDNQTRKAPGPFLSADAAMERLKETYGLREETIGYFRIEARPKVPSNNRSTRGAWAYPTAVGTRYKAFDRSSRPKYWWNRGYEKEKARVSLFGLRDLPLGVEVVYLVNGEPAVWVCWQARIPAVCAFGESNLPGEGVRQLLGLGVKEVRIIPDMDETGERAMVTNAAIIRAAGLRASASQLPVELGHKSDVCDLYLWYGKDDEAFRHALTALPAKEILAADPLQGTRFFQRDRRFYLRQQTRDGEQEVQLTNFVAWAKEEIVVDDGWDQTLHITLRGELDTGASLAAVQIPANRVHNLDWIVEKWGYTPTIRSGPGAKDIVREIIQMLSQAGLERRTVYSHTGWRQIDGQWRYLMPGGAVGVEGVDVELAAPYLRYGLPSKPGDPREAVQASLRFLDVAKRHVTLPLLAFAYLAPLQSILRPAFSLWLRANSGSFKSTLVALLVSHFGDFEYNTPPSTWDATVRGTERYLFDLKDVLAWIDDFDPRQTESQTKSQNDKANTILRAQGNLQSRVRMRSDLTMQRTFPPRALLISTGEIYPTGESLLARMLAIESMKSDVDLPRLTDAQREAHLYSHAMAAFVIWLGQRYDSLEKKLPRAHEDLRARIASGAGGEHMRTPGALAALYVAFDLFCEFAREVGAATEDDMEALRNQAWESFQELGRQQQSRLIEERPVDRYLRVIDALLAQGKVAIHKKGSDEEPRSGVDLIGWYDATYIYLVPEAAYNRVSRWFRDEGRSVGAGEADIRRSLLEEGILVRLDQSEPRLTTRLRVNARRHTVLALDISKVSFGEQFTRGG